MRTAIDIIVVIFAVVIGLIVIFYAVRRRERREVARFEKSFHMENSDFVAEMGLEAGTLGAEAALGFRSLIAKYAQIPAESVLPEHKFWEEYRHLPFFDSPDTLEFMMTIEDRFNITIPDESAEAIMSSVLKYNKNVTVKEMTNRFLAALQGLEKKDGKWIGI
jgi:acyl carrier protein